MKTKISLLTLILTVFALNATAQYNQGRWAFEFSTVASYTTADIENAKLNLWAQARFCRIRLDQ